jgi:conjugative transfer region protein TrbK
MDAKPIVRPIAIALLVGSALACTVETECLGQSTEPTRSLMQERGDLLTAELQRCKVLGAEGVNDSACKAAWARNRARFFALQDQTRDPFQVVPQQPSTKLPSEIFPDRAPTSPILSGDR